MHNYKNSIYYASWKKYSFFNYLYYILISSILHLLLILLGFKQLVRLLKRLSPPKEQNYYLENQNDIKDLKKQINPYFKKIRKSKYLIPNCLSTSIAVWLILRQQGLNTYIVIGTRKKTIFKAHAWVEYNKHPLNENFHIRKKYTNFDYRFLNI